MKKISILMFLGATVFFNFNTHTLSEEVARGRALEHIDSIVTQASSLENYDNNRLIKIKSTYQSDIENAKALLNKQGAAFKADNMAKLDNALNKYNDFFSTHELAYGAHKRGKGSSSVPPTPAPEPIDMPASQPAASTAIVADPMWSEALGKNEEGKSITIKNEGKDVLWVAVYEKYKGKIAKRYGNVYVINPGESNTAILRPDWGIFERRPGGGNDRLLFFSKNEADIRRNDRSVDEDSVDSISIGEGWNGKKTFSIPE
jgi:hypothetical protein